MNIMNLSDYREPKPRRLLRLLWVVINNTLFRLLDRHSRNGLLRAFGSKIGRDCLVYRSVKIYAPWNLSLGDMVCIGPRVDIFSKGEIEIGSGVVVSQDSYLCTGSHDISSKSMRSITKPISIGDNCWIASKCNILPGSVVEEGCVIGACAVVVGVIQSWSVAGGNPARVIKKREINKD